MQRLGRAGTVLASTPGIRGSADMARTAQRHIDAKRRAAIGAERRAKTRMDLLASALDLFGKPHGRNTRIEDVCARAGISRGTFYNYFSGIEPLLDALSGALTHDFDLAVHAAMEQLAGPLEQTSAAVRYYLHASRADPRWGWAVVNSSVGRTLYGERITRHVTRSIQEGMDCGDFLLDHATIGRDIVLGTGIAASVTLLNGKAPAGYPEKVARQVLLGLGASARRATGVTARPIRKLPRVETPSIFFRGSLGAPGG